MSRLADPWVLAALGPIWLLWALAWWLLPAWSRRRGRTPALRYSALGRLAAAASSSAGPRIRRAVKALRLVAVALLIVAMARPQVGRRLTQVSSQAVDIVLALDASGTMAALDLDAERPLGERRNRLEVAADVVARFVEARPEDQIGLVVFGEEAFTLCPLTLDHEIVRTFLERVEIGMAGDATAVGSALGVAAKRLRDSPARSKVVVLLTDGRSNAGVLSPRKAAEVASALGIKIYAVGVGSRGLAPMVNREGRVVEVEVDIDEESLREVADLTGGLFFRAEDTAGLEEVYRRIDELEKTEVTSTSIMEYEDLYPRLLTPALLLLLLEGALVATRYRRLPA